jgi:hypothetical protein
MGESAAYEETYRHYLARMARVDLAAVGGRLGVEATPEAAVIPFFGEPHRVGPDGVSAPDGHRPHLSICVILFHHVLQCPSSTPLGSDWVSFKDFRDAAPLMASFSSTVEGAIARAFSGRPDPLQRAAARLWSSAAPVALPYDITRVIPALPKVPLLLLFNDADEEFPAACRVLFERRAAGYLDMECLAMLGVQLARRLEIGSRG